MPSATETSPPSTLTPSTALQLRKGRRWPLWILVSAVTAVLTVACGGSDVIVPPTGVRGPSSQAVVVTRRLGVGKNGLAYGGGATRRSPVAGGPSATVRTTSGLPTRRWRQQNADGEIRVVALPGGVFTAHRLERRRPWSRETEFAVQTASRCGQCLHGKGDQRTLVVGTRLPPALPGVASECADLSHIPHAQNRTRGVCHLDDRRHCEGKRWWSPFRPALLLAENCGATGGISLKGCCHGPRPGQCHPLEVFGTLPDDRTRPGIDDTVEAGEVGACRRSRDLRRGRDGSSGRSSEAFSGSGLERR